MAAAAAEHTRISQVGLAARSPEGHAAKGGMAIKGNEDMWVTIQANTFRNWVNEHLKTVGLAVRDLATDFCDGTKLVALVEILQKRPLKHIKRPANPHQYLENVTAALNAVSEDGVKLVNIGNVDIVNGNLKLILGLIWSLIVRYQIGRSKFPPRKLMLSWLKAVLPECKVHNFTSDWNSGVYLSALLEYCRPGLFPHWRSLDPNDSVSNCRRSMEIAQREFNIPMVLEPEYLASPHLDELSGMTYLSYFMKEDSPGFHATLRWVNSQLPNRKVKNFTRDWNSGMVLCDLVHSLGGPVPNYKKMNGDQDNWENNLGLGIQGGKKLGVEPILKAKDMADQNVEHLGVMAYAAYFQWVRARNQPSERLAAHWSQHSSRINKTAQFKIECLEDSVEASDVTVEVHGPSGKVEARVNMTSSGGQGTCTPIEVGMYQLYVFCEGELIQGCPTSLRVMPENTAISYPGMEPCAIGSIVEVLVNSYGAKSGHVEVTAHSPTGRQLDCPVNEREGVYTANFQPDEAGEWNIHITHGGENIQGGPYTCFVFDPNGIKLEGLDGATPGRPHSFICDTSQTGGLGDVVLDIALSGKSIQHQVEELGPNRYRVSFLPAQPGKYKVYVYFNGAEIRGSAFSMRIGNYRSTKQHANSSSTSKIAHHNNSSSYTEQNSASASRGLSKDSYSHLNNSGQSKDLSYSHLNNSGMSKENYSSHLNSSGLSKDSYSHLNNSSVLSKESYSQLNNSGLSKDSYGHHGNSGLTKESYSHLNNSGMSKENYGHNSSGMSKGDSYSHLNNSSVLTKESYSQLNNSGLVAKDSYAHHSNSGLTKETYSHLNNSNNYSSSPQSWQYNSRLTQDDHYRQQHTPPAVNPSDIYAVSAKNANQSSTTTKVTTSVNTMNSHLRAASPVVNPPARFNPSPITYSATVKHSDSFNNDYGTTSVTESRYHSENRYSTSNGLNGGRLLSPPSPPQIRSSPLLNGSKSPVVFSTNMQRATPSPKPPGQVDTSSNVRVSSMLNNLNQRRDSWDAIAKTKSMLSHGSLESVANISAMENRETKYSSTMHSTVERVPAASNLSFERHSTLDRAPVASNLSFERHSTLDRAPALVSNTSFERHSTNFGSYQGMTSQLATSTDQPKLVSVHRQATVRVNAHGYDSMDVTATVTGPYMVNVPCSVSNRGEGEMAVNFVPKDIGEHVVEVKSGDVRVGGSPYRTHAYNSQAIQVGRIPDGTVGKPVEFEIDGSRAGSGNLEILVNGGHVTSFVKDLSGQRFLASFVPHEGGSHLVEMTFNGEEVPGSPWQVGVMASAISPPPSMAAPAKMTVLGEAVRLVACGASAAFELSAPGFNREEIQVQIISPSKRPVTSRLTEQGPGQFRVQFTPKEVGSHLVEVNMGGRSLPGGPLVAKVYNAALIRVTDVGSGVVGQPCQFKVDASQAGEGQLEISVNEGEVPNHVAVVGGGRCLVSFTPESAKPHMIDIKFNGEPVPGCPFVCSVSDTSRVSLTLRNLELVPVNEVAKFHIAVDGSGSAELAVSVRGPASELPVKVTGNVHNGFTAEFTPREVGGHSVTVEYNGHPVTGTPFIAKAYDPKRVFVGSLPRGSVGKTLQFTVDASQAGEGNLEITISARGHNIPTQVHPQGNARFAVSFIPLEATDHTISINFNKAPVPGSPFMARVIADPHHIVVSGQNLSSSAVGKPAYFSMANVTAALDDIEVNVEGPNGQSVAAQVKDSGNNSYRVEFSPRTAGEHRIAVSVSREPVPGSPFSCKAYDVKAIKVKASDTGSVGKAVTFLVETSQAGPGNLEVTVNGGRVPTSAQAQGIHTYAISFTPREALPHTVELRFNGEDVPGSPFSVDISEAARIMPGAEEKVPVGRKAQFWLQAAQGKPTVMVLSPSRRSLEVDVGEPSTTGPKANQLNVSFTPDEVGDHSVEVKISDAHVEGSPFLLKAYDSTKVKVTDVTSGVVGKPVYFSINASQAGAGNLEIIVSVNGRNVPNYVQSEGNARFRVNFKPQEAAPHLLSVRFNGELVPGSPFTCKILDAGQVLVMGQALRQAPISRPALLTIDPQNPSVQECVVTVLAPSGQNVPTVVSGSAQDKFFATFTPFEVGRHAVSVVLDSEHVKGSPFASNIYDVNQVKVTGLQSSGKVGSPVTFQVDAAEAGEGTLELVVSTAQGTVKAEVAACARGLYQVTFVPPRPEPHYVHISFNEEDVPGSPFDCQVSETGDASMPEGMPMRMPPSQGLAVKGEGLHLAVVGAPAFFDVDPGGAEAPDVEIMGPDGSDVQVRMVKVAGAGKYRAEYRPNMVGVHQVWVRRGGLAAADNPFEVEVFDPGQASITHVSEAICNQPTIFTVDMSRAGRGNLSVSVKAAGRDVKAAVRDIGHNRHEVSFLPSICTPHRVDVKLNGLHISGCPMEIAVRDTVVGKEMAATGKGLYQSEAGKEANFTIETLGRPAREFDVVITGPGGIAIPVRCYQQKDGNLLAQFTPPGAGSYKVDVLHGTKAVKNSPFFCQVYDSTKVRIANLGSKAVLVHEPISFQVLRKGAGFSELDVTVTSPLGQNLPLHLSSGDQPESDLITFTPSAPGQYRFNIKYGAQEVPGSPVTFVVSEEGNQMQNTSNDVADTSAPRTNGIDHREVSLSGPALEGCRVGRETYFLINSSKPSQGNPEASLLMDNMEFPVDIKPEGARVHRATFTPSESGNYKLRVKWAGKEIRGSPFTVLVSSVADSSQVVCSGEGLRVGTVGKEIRSFLDTRRAGPGELTAQCVGPNKVAYCELYDHGDGTFTLNVKPQEAGKHALTIKYGGQHVPGSPFSLRVAGSPDASKVRVFGPGIEHGVLATFQSRFVCDTRGAGAGQLTVRIRGPKGAFRVEMQRESQRDRSILCKYEPTEPGDYKLEVRWAGQHVPGSPFSVMIFDTQEELNKFVQGNGSPPGAPALSELYGSVGYSTAGYSPMNFQNQHPWRGSQAQL